MPLFAKRRNAALPTMARSEFERRILAEEGELTTLVLFDRGGEEDRLTEQALAGAARQHADRIRAFRADAHEFEDYFYDLQARRRDFDSYDFGRWPVVGVYRRGRLLTTFNPRRVFYVPQQQLREVREQLETFLEKMVYYDPSRVREQTNLEVAQKEHGDKERKAER